MGDLLEYLRSVLAHGGRRLWLAMVLVLAGALVEGFGILAILPFAALFTGEAETGPARTAQDWFAWAGIETPYQQALALVGLFIVLLAIRNLIVWRRDTYLFLLGAQFVDHWRQRLFEAIARAPWSRVNAARRTDLEHAITNDVARLSGGTDRVLRTSVAVALIVIQLGIVAALAPLLLLVVLVLFSIAAAFTYPLVRKASTMGERLTQSGRRIHGVLGDFMAGQKIARLANAEHRFLDHFDHAVDETRALQAAYMSSQSAARAWFQLVAGIMVAASLLAGYFWLETPIPILLVAIVVLARLVPPMMQVTQTMQAAANMLPAYRNLSKVEGELLTEASSLPRPASQSTRAPGPISLELRDVCFTHSGQEGPTLDGVSLTVGAGEVVALAGSSGRGKTTLLDIATGLLTPQSGKVMVEGEILASEAEWAGWRSQLAYLPQDPYLFDASVRENLCWSAPEAGEDALWEVLAAAEGDALVRGLPGGLDARIGERGSTLSGGERQRICLARALLAEPRFLILDEATNALDRELEHRIIERLKGMRGRFSLLYVTHRTEAAQQADRLVTL